MQAHWLTAESVPISGMWLGGSEESPFARHFWFCLLAEGPDPRLEERRRWDVIRYDRYLDDRIWRVEHVEVSPDELRVRAMADGLGKAQYRLFPLTVKWVKSHGLNASPSCIASHWIIDQPVVRVSEAMNLHLSNVIERRKKEIQARATHPFKPTEAMITALSRRYQKILLEPLTLGALHAEPKGRLSVARSWAVSYQLLLRDGRTFLKTHSSNRFTNDSEDEIDEDGRLNPKEIT